MIDIKSKILQEVEFELGSGAVMVVAEAMDKCPTLSKMISASQAAEYLCELAAIECQVPVSMLKGEGR